MGDADAVVFVVDDDDSVLKGLSRLLRSAGWKAMTYASPDAFLRAHDPRACGCLILDVAMPDVDGLELQRRLTDAGCTLPIVFLTGHGDVSTSVRAMRAGALNFLTKPIDDEELLGAVREAVARDRVARSAARELDVIHERLATLTPRERQVLERVVTGKLNKQIADDLGIVEKTIKVHRAHVMEKMGVRSLAELARIAERIGVAKTDGR